MYVDRRGNKELRITFKKKTQLVKIIEDNDTNYKKV